MIRFRPSAAEGCGRSQEAATLRSALARLVIILCLGGRVWAEAEDQPVPPISLSQEKVVPGVRPGREVPNNRTTSASGQFIVHGTDTAARSAAASTLDQLRADFVALIDRRSAVVDALSSPPDAAGSPKTIVVRLQATTISPQATIIQLPGDWALELQVGQPEMISTEAGRLAVNRLLLAERLIRPHTPAAVGESFQLPPWLEAAIPEAIDLNTKGKRSSVFAHLVKSGTLMPAEEVLSTDPAALDPLSRGLWKASASGLLMMLLEQPQGPERFRFYLSQIAISNDSHSAQVIKAFPNLKLSRQSLEKWWALKAAELAQPGALERLSPKETDDALSAALIVKWRELKELPKAAAVETPLSPEATNPETATAKASFAPSKSPAGGVKGFLKKLIPGRKEPSESSSATADESGTRHVLQPLEPPVEGKRTEQKPPEGQEMSCAITDLDKIFTIKDRDMLLRPNVAALAQLQANGFPLFRPIIADYQDLLASLVKKRPKQAEATLQRLANERQQLLSVMDSVSDYLNWYEATQLDRPSGLFDEALNALPAPTSAKPRSTDPITIYMDEMEKEFQK